MNETDISIALAETVRAAAARHTRLAIRGAGSKRFYTGESDGTPLDIAAHRGIVSYEPTELVLTARAGTPLAAIEAVLAEHDQMLGFEPPHFADGIETRGAGATLGGTLACGLSGPRRPYAGSARDFVLGTQIINGRGEVLRFGGQVMKNVAGYDLSRLMVGAFGTLGVILEASLKVLPRPAAEVTLAFEMPADAALRRMNDWAAQPLPLSGAAHGGDRLHIRLAGAESAIRAAHRRLGGELLPDNAYWQELREHRRLFFASDQPLWRLSVPPASPMLDLPGRWKLDWGGAQRWLLSDAPRDAIHRAAQEVGGHALLFRHRERPPRAALPAASDPLARRLAQAFDPAGIFSRENA
jgi:glycolate oxidase FAD binding subunit